MAHTPSDRLEITSSPDAGNRVGNERTRSWTGRSVVSRATDSALPTTVTTGTHKTRVSEMRDVAARAARCFQHGTPAGTGSVTPQRRMSSGRPPVSG